MTNEIGLTAKDSATQFAEPPSTSFERSGTIRWMAPELVDEDQPCRSRSSDIWAFACTVLEVSGLWALLSRLI